VWLDPAADRSIFNVDQLASAIACGAAAENARLAAGACGLRAEVEVRDPGDGGPVATLRLAAAGPQATPDPLHDAIWRRCTNRRPFRADPVPPELLERLGEVAAGAGARLHLLDDRPRLERLARLLARVDQLRAEHRGAHEHFVRMVRWTAREARATRDGLPLPTLEAGAGGAAFLRLTRRWRAMAAANRLGASRLLAGHAARGIRRSGAAALLTVDGEGLAAFARGGQALQRVWLELTRLGLQLQPMTAATLFWIRWARPDHGGFAPAAARLLGEGWEEWRALFPDAGPAGGQVMLFRLGFGPPARARTLRKEPESKAPPV
jgi:hypothetical protein